MAINKKYLESGRTSESDECLTPRYVVEPIIKYLKQRNFKKILCPFDKEHSLYVRLLKENGFEVLFSHISMGGGNFFDLDFSNIDFDCIVSNPPFSKKDEILKKLYEINKPFAILLPQNSLQSITRTKLFIKYGVEYLGFDKRACFYTKNELDKIKFSNHFASGYFCKDVLPEKLIFEELNPIQESYRN